MSGEAANNTNTKTAEHGPKTCEHFTAFDRIYLGLAENEITGYFSELCFEHKVHSLEDFKQILAAHKKPALRNQGKLGEALHLAANKKTDFNKLAKKHGKFDHEAKLAKEGVPIIPFSDVQVHKRLGTGPLSGVALSATLKQNGKMVRVCIRYPRSDQQLESFLNEAKMLSKLVHPNILKLHGVVVLGVHVNSIALVMEFAPNGNIVESLMMVSVKNFCKIMPQILSVLQFVDSKGFVHARLSEFAVFLFSPTMVKIGGFGGCVEKPSLKDEIKEKAKLHNNRSSLNFMVSSPYKKGMMIAWFAVFVERMFFLLERCRPRDIAYINTGNQGQKHARFCHFCPEVLQPLLKRCWLTNDNTVPPFKEIFEVIQSKDFPPMVQMKASSKAEHPGDISVNKDEQVLVISKSLTSEHRIKTPDNFWLGEKDDGKIGLFDGNLAIPIFNTESLTDAAGADCEEGTQVPTEIKARGPRAELAYRRALKQGKVVVNRGRIMLVGQERAGKTSLKKSLLGLPFDPREESTVGVEVDPSCCSIDVDNVKNWQRTTDCTQTDFADNIARLIADDLKNVEDEEQTEQEDKMKEEKNDETNTAEHTVKETSQDDTDSSDQQSKTEDVSSDPESSLVSESQETFEESPSKATEPDAVPEDVTEKVVHYLQGLNLDDSSTKSQTIVSIWDFAGQHLYYASHPVFLSPRALYLMVYNLSKDLNSEAEPCVRQGAFDIFLENDDKQTNLEALLSWLSSIHSIRPSSDQEEELESSDARKVTGNCPYLRPPVIVVGTNSDRPFEDSKKMEVQIKKSLSGKSFQQHLVKPFFTVNNTLSSTDQGVQRLQGKIIEVLEMEPYMGEHIPVRWLMFEKVIKALVEKKTHYLLLLDLEKIVLEVCFIEESDEIHAMLDYYHDLGVIIKHGDTVVLQSQWLIDLFRKLITVRPYDDQNPLYEECWNDLEESGILRMELVEHVFSELLDSGQSREDLLGMMEHYGLIAGFDKGVDVRYFVPAQLRSSPEVLLDIQPSPVGPCALYVHFVDGFVPHGLYSWFVSKFIAWCSKSKDGSPHEPNLYRNVSRFILGKSSDYELILICRKRFIKVVLRSLQENKSCLYQPAVSVRRFIESTLTGISVVCTWYRSMRYKLTVLCPSCSESLKPCTKHRVVACSNDDCIHLLEVSDQQVLVCTKSFGKDSRPEVPNLEAWYATPKPAAGSIPTDKLMCLAYDMGDKWKVLGRALGLEEADLDEIEVDENQLYEQCYAVLKRWTEISGSSANYEVLSAALMHPAVQMSDLAWKYCGSVGAAGSDMSDGASDDALPDVFISYQWDIQSTILELSSVLKENGFNCWVDVGQMGGGDSLYAELDKGIRSAKVVISCVTDRYCKSENCQREATLADSIKKPIIPLLLEPIPWPPAGQLGLIFAKLLYIDMTQGYQAKMDELLKKIKMYTSK